MKAEKLEDYLDYEISDLDAALQEKSLYEFVKGSWPVFEPDVPFQDNWHIGAQAEHLQAVFEGQIQNLLITISPGSSKSTIASVCFPAWVWVNRPSYGWIFTSYKQELATRDSIKCRNIIESEWYKMRWGDRFWLTGDQNAKTYFRNSQAGERMAVGITGGTGMRADCVVGDDIHDIGDQWSPDAMAVNIQRWDAIFSQRHKNPREFHKVLVMQRISTRDAAEHVIKQGGYEHLLIPQEYDPKRSKVTAIKWKDPRTQPGELMDPRRFGPEQREQAIRSLTLRGYGAQHQQNPSTDEDAIFGRHYWNRYQGHPLDIVHRIKTVIQSWDLTTGGVEPGSSKVAGHVWGRVGANYLLLDRVHDFMSMPQILDGIRLMSIKWPQARTKLIETKAAGSATIAMLKNEISGIIGWPLESSGRMPSKVERAYVCQPLHQAGNLFLPESNVCLWADEVIEYCAVFPAGAFDDDIDALTQAIMYLESRPGDSAPVAVGKAAPWLR